MLLKTIYFQFRDAFGCSWGASGAFGVTFGFHRGSPNQPKIKQCRTAPSPWSPRGPRKRSRDDLGWIMGGFWLNLDTILSRFRGETRQEKTRQATGQDKTRQDKTRQDKTRQDTRHKKRREEKTRRDKTRHNKRT